MASVPMVKCCPEGITLILHTLCFPLTAHISLSSWPDRHVNFYKGPKKKVCVKQKCTNSHMNSHLSGFTLLSLDSLYSFVTNSFPIFCRVFYILESERRREQYVMGILPGKEWSHSCRILSDWLGTPDLCGQKTTKTHNSASNTARNTHFWVFILFCLFTVFFFKVKCLYKHSF